MEFDLGSVKDFPDRAMRVVTIEARELVVARWAEEVFVFRNICPHRAGPLASGGIVAGLTCSATGELQVDDDHPIAVCAWHRWEFGLSDGVSVRDSRTRLKIYPTRVENGQVIVELASRQSSFAEEPV